MEQFLSILESLVNNILVPLAPILIAFFVLKKQNRPEILTHLCRISDLHVYTYFDEKNKHQKPMCPFLSKDNINLCKYNKIEENDIKKEIQEINHNKCYLTFNK